MQSVMKHDFSQVPKAEIPRSTFDRSHGLKTTLTTGGVLYPIFIDEALPGDTHILNLTAFARLATPIVPLMDNMKMTFFFFFVPLRLIWDNFQKMMGEQVDPGDSTDFTCPKIDINGDVALGSIYDYFGLPIGVASSTLVNAFHFRAYNLIWNEWFRDQNLQDSLTVDRTDGPDVTVYTLQRRGKRHDYFTSALPWPQKGTAVTLPLGTEANILWRGVSDAPSGFDGNPKMRSNVAQAPYTEGQLILNYNQPYHTDGSGNEIFSAGGFNYTWSTDPQGSLYADLTTATAATINDLREAFQLQKLYEKDARGGTRYTEIIRSHFGVVSPDARLQRPEYLGGGSIPINISPVAQTSSTDATTPQGNLAAYGTAGGSGVGFSASFVEHGVLLGLVCVDADLTYSQGINRMWDRTTRYDFYWPSFAHLGEQTIKNQEIFFDTATPANNALTFGYQERYAEYRYKPSMITGLFRPGVAGTLDVWHLSEELSSPALNAAFIVSDPPLDRVVAVPSEPKFLYDSYLQYRSVRPMPVFSVPGLIDHF